MYFAIQMFTYLAASLHSNFLSYHNIPVFFPYILKLAFNTLGQIKTACSSVHFPALQIDSYMSLFSTSLIILTSINYASLIMELLSWPLAPCSLRPFFLYLQLFFRQSFLLIIETSFFFSLSATMYLVFKLLYLKPPFAIKKISQPSCKKVVPYF